MTAASRRAFPLPLILMGLVVSLAMALSAYSAVTPNL